MDLICGPPVVAYRTRGKLLLTDEKNVFMVIELAEPEYQVGGKMTLKRVDLPGFDIAGEHITVNINNSMVLIVTCIHHLPVTTDVIIGDTRYTCSMTANMVAHIYMDACFTPNRFKISCRLDASIKTQPKWKFTNWYYRQPVELYFAGAYGPSSIEHPVEFRTQFIPSSVCAHRLAATQWMEEPPKMGWRFDGVPIQKGLFAHYRDIVAKSDSLAIYDEIEKKFTFGEEKKTDSDSAGSDSAGSSSAGGDSAKPTFNFDSPIGSVKFDLGIKTSAGMSAGMSAGAGAQSLITPSPDSDSPPTKAELAQIGRQDVQAAGGEATDFSAVITDSDREVAQAVEAEESEENEESEDDGESSTPSLIAGGSANV